MGDLRFTLPVSVISKAEHILKGGGTAPLSFTLHDGEHSFRVAQTSFDLLPYAHLDEFSEVELMMLLMACFIHDIGMIPPQPLVARLRSWLITGDDKVIMPDEIASLQSWLDESDYGRLPLDGAGVSPADLGLTERALMYYIRHMHNEWSADWLSALVDKDDSSLYAGWRDDLIALCKSHHVGIEGLREKRFHARVVPGTGASLNLRYLAVILRVADVMEFDPERTPRVIMDHRGVDDASKIFWYKDHQIGFRLDSSSHQIFLSARTPNAIVHKAVLDTADQVDAELSIASILHREAALHLGTISDLDRKRYVWEWPSQTARDVSEVAGTFKFIDGSFRPSTTKILDLLAGTQLYGTRSAAMRELLQNAFDAVRERMAYERLREAEPGADETAQLISKRHLVDLVFYRRGGRIWIDCSDDGIGMNEKIISRNLLVSGSPPPAEIKALQRSIRDYGFSLYRSGEFGVGSLSYFMLADKVEIDTRRAPEISAGETNGWSFSIDGIDGFGELRQTARSAPGTQVSLRLKNDLLVDGAEQYVEKLVEYVERTCCWLPCKLRIENRLSNVMKELGPQWTNSIGNSASAPFNHALEVDAYQQLDLQTNEQKVRSAAKLTSIQSVIDRASQVLQWDAGEGIEDSAGNFVARVHVPFFTLRNKKSSAYLHIDGEIVFELVDRSNSLVPSTEYIESWRGFHVDAAQRGLPLNTVSLRNGLASIEIDFRKGRQVRISRDNFVSDIDVDQKSAVLSMIQLRAAEAMLA